MVVVSRKTLQENSFEGRVCVKLLEILGNRMRLQIEAPSEYSIVCQEMEQSPPTTSGTCGEQTGL